MRMSPTPPPVSVPLPPPRMSRLRLPGGAGEVLVAVADQDVHVLSAGDPADAAKTALDVGGDAAGHVHEDGGRVRDVAEPGVALAVQGQGGIDGSAAHADQVAARAGVDQGRRAQAQTLDVN